MDNENNEDSRDAESQKHESVAEENPKSGSPPTTRSVIVRDAGGGYNPYDSAPDLDDA